MTMKAKYIDAFELWLEYIVNTEGVITENPKKTHGLISRYITTYNLPLKFQKNFSPTCGWREPAMRKEIIEAASAVVRPSVSSCRPL